MSLQRSEHTYLCDTSYTHHLFCLSNAVSMSETWCGAEATEESIFLPSQPP